MPHQGGGSRASMATDFAKAPVEGGSSPRTGPTASTLGRLAHLLARQAAREAIASDLGTEQHQEGPATEAQPVTDSRQIDRSAP
jgi:hypothetical protein